MLKQLLALAFLTLAIAGCSGDSESNTASSDSRPVRLSDESLANATYELNGSQRFKLTAGSYSSITANQPSASRDVVQLLPLQAHGDIDGDSRPDSAVIVTHNAGGSGTFVHLVAALNRGGNAEPVPGVLLGDRVVVNSLEVSAGQVLVKLKVQGPGEPLCCPTLEATRVYALDGRNLKLVSKTD